MCKPKCKISYLTYESEQKIGLWLCLLAVICSRNGNLFLYQTSYVSHVSNSSNTHSYRRLKQICTKNWLVVVLASSHTVICARNGNLFLYETSYVSRVWKFSSSYSYRQIKQIWTKNWLVVVLASSNMLSEWQSLFAYDQLWEPCIKLIKYSFIYTNKTNLNKKLACCFAC